ncbi:MAG TPA: zinc ribbon domain-containing protein [Candidatus Sulfopaludibacter sp.]|jgi:hypothetical protein|nr:zinc ribbon domain-containing protein [Candidatus Sulfopaludibacter sp.]
MFTWICPQCGKEVPPAYTDCPNCADKKTEQAPPTGQAAPQQAAVPQQAPPPQPYAYAPPRKRGLPTWLLTILVAGGTAAVIFGAIWLFSNKTETKPSAAVESPAAKPGAAPNPIQKSIEISGVRFAEDPKHKTKTIVKFLVVNHSGMDLAGLTGNVTMWGSTRKSDEDAQGTFTFSTDLHPYASKELEAPLNTKFKIYELPDWQNIAPDVQITAPVISGSR